MIGDWQSRIMVLIFKKAEPQKMRITPGSWIYMIVELRIQEEQCGSCQALEPCTSLYILLILRWPITL